MRRCVGILAPRDDATETARSHPPFANTARAPGPDGVLTPPGAIAPASGPVRAPLVRSVADRSCPGADYRRGDRPPGGLGRGQRRVPGDPQADRAVLSGERRARQDSRRDLAELRAA